MKNSEIYLAMLNTGFELCCRHFEIHAAYIYRVELRNVRGTIRKKKLLWVWNGVHSAS
jgi:hypothetical protein